LRFSAEQAGLKLRLRDGQNVDCDSASDNHGCINNLPQKSEVIIGPNAVLAFGREAYENTQFDISEVLDTLGYEGFWKLFTSLKIINVRITELNKSYRKTAFVNAAQKLLSRS